jgi:TPR repeat protein
MIASNHFSVTALLIISLGQHNYAQCLFKGDGIPEDPAAAAHWYNKAAKKGHAKAQYMAAYCYHKGLGVPQDLEKAVKYYTKSSNSGEAKATEALQYLQNKVQ